MRWFIMPKQGLCRMASAGVLFAGFRPCGCSALSESIEEREELVIGLEASWRQRRSSDAGEGLFLYPHVGVDVNLGGRN
jgi:hypothetical protein